MEKKGVKTKAAVGGGRVTIGRDDGARAAARGRGERAGTAGGLARAESGGWPGQLHRRSCRSELVGLNARIVEEPLQALLKEEEEEEEEEEKEAEVIGRRGHAALGVPLTAIPEALLVVAVMAALAERRERLAKQRLLAAS